MAKEMTTPNPREDRTQGRNGAAADFRGDNPVSANLRTIAAALRRDRRIIVLILAAAVALAAIVTLMSVPRYTAMTSLQIDDHGDEVLGDELNENAAGNADRDLDRFLHSQLEILRSRTLALRVASSLALDRDPQFFSAMRTAAPDAALSVQYRRELLVKLLRENLSVELPRSTRIVRIQFSSADPNISARIANAFAEEFVQAKLKQRVDSSNYSRAFVAEQLDKARTQLEASEQNLNDYARTAGLAGIREAFRGDDRTPVVSSMTATSLRRINDATTDARANRIEAQARWNVEAATPLLASRTVLANPTVQELMTRRARLRTDFARARTR